jgi:hypothetical protein
MTTQVGETLFTDSSGSVTVTLENGEYYFLAEKEDYNDNSLSFTVSDAPETVGFTMIDTPPPPIEYTVTFQEEDNLSGVSIQLYSNSGRTTMLGSSFETNAYGSATVNLENGEYWFTAKRTNYDDYNGDFIVNDVDRAVQFKMENTSGGGGGSPGGSNGEEETSSVEEESMQITIVEGQDDDNDVISTAIVNGLSLSELKKRKEKITKLKGAIEILIRVAEQRNNMTARTILSNILNNLNNIESETDKKINEKETALQSLNNQKRRIEAIQKVVQQLYYLAIQRGNNTLIDAVLRITNTLSDLKKEVEEKIILI